jgi:uncharacterized membrane protein HdeD (DUF308 family)
LGWAISYNFVRLTPKIKRKEFLLIYVFIILAACYINVALPNVRRYAFAATIGIYLITQVIVDLIIQPWRRGIEYYFYMIAFGSIGVAFGIWVLDGNGTLCSPNR